MLHVIERIVNFLAADADEEAVQGSAEYALKTLLKSKRDGGSVEFYLKQIYNITNTKDDYTIEYSKRDSDTHFTVYITNYPGITPKCYVARGSDRSKSKFINTERDLASYMTNMR